MAANASYWSIQTSQAQCSATWYFGNGHALRIVENANTRALRALIHPDLDADQPIVQFWLGSGQNRSQRTVFDRWHLPLGDEMEAFVDLVGQLVVDELDNHDSADTILERATGRAA